MAEFDNNQTPQQPEQPPVYTPEVMEDPQAKKYGKGFAIASMCCGIASIVFCCAWYLAIPAAGVALVMGILNLMKHGAGRGMALAGVICGGVGLFLALGAVACACMSCGGCGCGGSAFYNEMMNEIMREMY